MMISLHIPGAICILWAVNLLAQNFAFTFVSRARNSGSLKRHIYAAIASNAVFILQLQIMLGPMMDYLNGKHGLLLQAAVAAFYTAFTVTGSVLAHIWSMKTEKGKSRVGASADRAEITPTEWKRVLADLQELRERQRDVTGLLDRELIQSM